MFSQLRPALASLLTLTVITGVLYPAFVTGIAKVAFARRAGGSLVEQDGKVVGSELIGQPFSEPRYFWPRPSATSPHPYNAAAGSGSNLAPSNPALAQVVRQRVAALKEADPANVSPVPVDLVTASGSGLDPHISVAAARYQSARVARVRNLPAVAVERLVGDYTEQRALGVLGEPVVNVLKLNLALDGHPVPAATRGDIGSRWPMSTH